MNREKKQIVIVGVLALMVVSVGAFQVLKGSAPAAVAAGPTEAEKAAKIKALEENDKEAAASAIKNPTYAASLSRRDPFKIADFAISQEDRDKEEEEKQRVAQEKRDAEAAAARKKPIHNVPPALAGPTSYDPGATPYLPDANGSGVVPEVKTTPVEPPKFGYRLIGFVKGARDAAVFQDGSGNQRLVAEGQAIDGDSTLLSVSRGSVRVRFHARTLVLSVGESK